MSSITSADVNVPHCVTLSGLFIYSVHHKSLVADSQVYVQGGYLCTGCNASCALFTAASGSFSDGSPGQYEDNSDCSWIIAPPPQLDRTVQITITFTSVNTESGYDYIWVYTCTNISCVSKTLLAQISGDQTGSYISTSGYVLVRFTSDKGVKYDGFEAMWTSLSLVRMVLYMQEACDTCLVHTGNKLLLTCIYCSDIWWACGDLSGVQVGAEPSRV
jgi:hypothetical protein